MTKRNNSTMPYFSPEEHIEIESAARRTIAALRVNMTSASICVAADAGARVSLTDVESLMLGKFVRDVSDSRIGIATVTSKGTLRVGNPLAVPIDTSMNELCCSEPHGIHIHLDADWTMILKDGLKAGEATVAGVVASLVDVTLHVSAAASVGDLVNWIGGLKWSILRPHAPSAVTLSIGREAALALALPTSHCVTIPVRIWNPGAWNDRRTFGLNVTTSSGFGSEHMGACGR